MTGAPRLRGLHHVTAVTADAPGAMRFYAGLLGLRVVKRTVDFDAPDVWHLYFGDDRGTPGSLVTFIAFPNAGRGRAGTTLPPRLELAVGSGDELGALAERLAEAGADLDAAPAGGSALAVRDPEGLALELAAGPGAHGVTPRPAGATLHGDPDTDRSVLTDVLGMTPEGDDAFTLGTARLRYVPPPAPPVEGELGAGAIHHLAWIAAPDELEAWRARLAGAGLEPTPVRDRHWFRSVYFRLPGGVLFELATDAPGLAAEGISDRLDLPPWLEHLRPRLERSLTPLPPSDRLRPWRRT